MFRSEYLSGMREMLTMPLASDGGLVFFSDRRGSFTAAVFPVPRELAGLVSLALKNEKISHELVEILQGEAAGRSTYGDIVGRGPAMQAVFELLSRVSFSDSTVLVLGETGTGKELVARAIHHSSPRKEKLMVKVNCAALPANLIESELFGHEKGSFTGATDRRIGKFELANNGTLFLDEIGEMPADLQVKLLRALQEKEIERIGGKGPIKVNVRIIAATNRNLQHEVDEGRFRRDLYYRLNVFPIHLPPLRGRREDIPALVMNFVEKFSKNAGKRIGHVSGKAMKELMAYDWPGNVRELEHLIERSVLLAKGDTIRDVHLPGGGKGGGGTALLEEGTVKTFEENEREHILRALKRCSGKVYGPGGAAELLGLNSSTLNSKIRKLGIQIGRTFYKK
jgi:transcriptional regulator with GAF, ATPase, and Fis domain